MTKRASSFSTMSLILFNLFSSPVLALTLDQFLEQVESKNAQFAALNYSESAVLSRRTQGDNELSPYLSGKVQNFEDKKPSQFGPTTILDRTAGTEYSLGLSKKFSTGTFADLTGTFSNIGLYFPDGAGGYQSPRYTGGLGLSLSQSLWKDFFGAATSLRRDRDVLIETTEKAVLQLQRRQLQIDAEAAYWDFIYIKEEVFQREKSLDRARKIESWVKGRFSNGIGDRSDLLNAQGLMAGRELQLLNAKDESQAIQEKVRLLLQLSKADPLPEIKGQLTESRNPKSMVTRLILTSSNEKSIQENPEKSKESIQKVVKMDAYLASLESKTKNIVSQEISEQTKPTVTLTGLYKANSFEVNSSDALNKITDTSKPTMAIGLSFSIGLDRSLTENARSAARSEARAAELREQRKQIESESAWNEFLRRHQELNLKVEAAQKASLIQEQKATAEREKLSKGRSITTQVVQAEQDASESALTLAKMRSEQRKMEAQTRMFVQVEETP